MLKYSKNPHRYANAGEMVYLERNKSIAKPGHGMVKSHLNLLYLKSVFNKVNFSKQYPVPSQSI